MKFFTGLVLCALLFLSSCNKDIQPTDENPETLENISISPDFDWKSTQQVVITIASSTSKVIEVTSEDGTQTIHKGFYRAVENENYSTQINIPSYYKKIRINNNSVEISSGNIFIDLDMGNHLKNTSSANLVSYWALDENTGNTVSDAIGTNDGMVIGSTWTTGISGSALQFNGTSNGVQIPETPSLDIVSDLSLTAWVKTTDNRTAKIAEKGDWNGFGLSQDKWNGWQATITTSDLNNHDIEWGEGVPLMDTWYFLAMTWDGSMFRFYVNGVKKDSLPVSGTLYNNGNDFWFGSNSNSQKFFEGTIDEVALYGSALSAQEIQSFYQTLPNTDSDGDGVPDFQDDYPSDGSRAFNVYWPAGEQGCIAFEDLWPALGDFDFNDLVLGYRFQSVVDASNYVTEVYGYFSVRAIGASYKNGFGFQFTNNFPVGNLTVTGSNLSENNITLLSNGTEANQNLSTVIVFDNASTVLLSTSGMGVNTNPSVPYVEPDTLTMTFDFANSTYTLADIDIENFNPFIIVDGNRGTEVHLADYAPSNLANLSLLGTFEDDSDPSIGKYYKTQNNIPWAIMLPEVFDYPTEKSRIDDTFVHFISWGQSSGVQHTDWYKDISGHRNVGLIY